MEVRCSPETSTDFKQAALLYGPEETILDNHRGVKL
jgi:hypothetical protein